MSNRLDQLYRSLVLSKYFTKGWGKPENLKRICEFRKVVSNRESCFKLVAPDYPVYIERELDYNGYSLFDGYFFTPFAQYLPEVVPTECCKAYFQLVLPKKWQSEKYKPVVLQIAGTGDQYYWRRRNLIAKPLIKEAGIGSIILENPFYGRRRPLEQRRTILHNVSDIFVMGGCLILESMVLFHFCERLGYGPLGVTGLSMGGHMASLAATCWPKPLIVVPCLSGLTASSVFTQGVISGALNWEMLEKQFHSDSSFKEEMAKMINISHGNAFRAGQKFAQSLSSEPSLDYSDRALENFDRSFSQKNSIDCLAAQRTDDYITSKMIKTEKNNSTSRNTLFSVFKTADDKTDTLYSREMISESENSKEPPDSKFSFTTLSTNFHHLFSYSFSEENRIRKLRNERFVDDRNLKVKASCNKNVLSTSNSLTNLTTFSTYSDFPARTTKHDVTSLQDKEK